MAVTGNSNWVIYRYAVGTIEPDIIWKQLRIKSKSAIQAELIGAVSAAGFGGYYSGFGEIPKIQIEGTANGCVKQSTLSVASGLGVYQWYKNGSPIIGENSASYVMSVNDSYPAEECKISTCRDDVL